HRRPGTAEELAVIVAELVAALVEHGQAHHPPARGHRADRRDLVHPAGGDPRPRAEGVEPEVDGDRTLARGHASSSASLSVYPGNPGVVPCVPTPAGFPARPGPRFGR